MFVSATQINFLVPSNTPTGPSTLQITFNGETSAALDVQIVSNGVGLFTFSFNGYNQRAVVQNYNSGSDTPVNLPSVSAKPGQTLIAYGTGLGAINAPDNLPAPAGDIPGVNVEIFVGGVLVTTTYAGRSPCCSGLDQLVFILPANVPLGCTVPIVIRTGSTYSNAGAISIAANGGQCSDFANLPTSQYCKTGTGARVVASETLLDAAPGIVGLSGTATAQFYRSNGCVNVPTPGFGTCAVSIKPLTEGSHPIPFSGAGVPQLGTFPFLDAGATAALQTPSRTVNFQSVVSTYTGFYNYGTTPETPMLGSGAYTFSAPGGRDVGPLSASFDWVPLRITSHRPQGPLRLNVPPTVTWSGGQYARDFLFLDVRMSDGVLSTHVSCTLAGATAGSFTIPAYIWAQIPPYKEGGGAIYISGTSLFDPIHADVPGLDLGVDFYMLSSHDVQVQFEF
ncbi:MAG: hypothetical protein WDO18_04635 [Acidobacteriota bacterium]